MKLPFVQNDIIIIQTTQVSTGLHGQIVFLCMQNLSKLTIQVRFVNVGKLVSGKTLMRFYMTTARNELDSSYLGRDPGELNSRISFKGNELI